MAQNFQKMSDSLIFFGAPSSPCSCPLHSIILRGPVGAAPLAILAAGFARWSQAALEH